MYHSFGAINEGPQSGMRSLSAMSKDPGLIAAEEILVGAHEGPAEAWFSVHGFTSAVIGQVRGPVGGGPGTRPWAQFWSHPSSGPFTADRRPHVRPGRNTGGRWRTVVRSTRKRVRGQPLRGFKSHLHRFDLRERRSCWPTGGRLVHCESHLVVSVTSVRGASHRESCAVMPGQGCCGPSLCAGWPGRGGGRCQAAVNASRRARVAGGAVRPGYV